ncbi:MAG: hypothetical protein A2V90_02935 [Gammaproteobacteria bacterium RBG_16_57_12]|nr:MAG: hypothetical protein A2V90_02935 [Gammaproteobacteria bacterium RBG_16_57_12]
MKISTHHHLHAHPERPSILIVDDDPDICQYIDISLQGSGYTTQQAQSGEEALEKIRIRAPDLILLDIIMPGMGGIEAARLIKSAPETQSLPIAMITVADDREAKLRCLEIGVEDFLNKPLDYAELFVRVRNLLRLKNYNDVLSQYSQTLETQVQTKTREVKQYCIETVITLTRAAEYRDVDTGGHVSRVSQYSRELACSLGMDQAFCEDIFYASPMHDIGKIAIPDSILLKPQALSSLEWEVMKTHTTLGREILIQCESPYLLMGADIAQSHHERWDGGGYPAGLAGEQIPLAARIMALCDVYDALRSRRPYKPPYSHKEAVNIIQHGDAYLKPGYFDPRIYQAFLNTSDHFDAIFEDTRPNQLQLTSV